MSTEELKLNVEKALDEIRPFLQSDGGDINLLSIEDEKFVKVQLVGACTSCSVNQMTLNLNTQQAPCRGPLSTQQYDLALGQSVTNSNVSAQL